MNEIRRATEADIPGILKLLVQVDMVHHNGRPDIFKSIELSPDGKSVIITLSSGQVYTVPLK